MKSFSNFKDYSRKRCIKTNLITASVFIIAVLLMTVVLFMFFIWEMIMDINGDVIVNDSNSFGSVIVFALGFFIMNIIMIIITILTPMFIDIYEHYLDNLKSLAGLGVCNLIFIYFISKVSSYFIKYILFSMVASLVILSCKYIFIKMKLRKCNVNKVC